MFFFFCNVFADCAFLTFLAYFFEYLFMFCMYDYITQVGVSSVGCHWWFREYVCHSFWSVEYGEFLMNDFLIFGRFLWYVTVIAILLTDFFFRNVKKNPP